MHLSKQNCTQHSEIYCVIKNQLENVWKNSIKTIGNNANVLQRHYNLIESCVECGRIERGNFLKIFFDWILSL